MIKYMLCYAFLYLTFLGIGFIGGMEYSQLKSNICTILKVNDDEKSNNGSHAFWPDDLQRFRNQ